MGGRWLSKSTTRVALLAPLVAGCWREPSESLRGSIVSDVALATELRQLTMVHLGAVSPDVVSMVLPSMLRTFTIGCQPDSTGIHTRNAAGIPQDQRLTFQCETMIAQTRLTKRGSVRIEALDDAFAARLTYENLRSTMTIPSGSVEVSVNGVVEIRTLDRTTLEIREQMQEALQTPAGGVTRFRDLVRTVSDTGSILPPHYSLDPPTSITIAGAMWVTDTRQPRDTVRLTISTPVPLRPDRNCLLNGGFRSGELRGCRQRLLRAWSSSRSRADETAMHLSMERERIVHAEPTKAAKKREEPEREVTTEGRRSLSQLAVMLASQSSLSSVLKAVAVWLVEGPNGEEL